MERRLNVSDIQPVPHLPPAELIAPQFRTGRKKIETPLDSRNLVDAPKLFQEINKTVDSSYDWKSRFNDTHHLQWPSRTYDENIDNLHPQEFRNLAISQWVLPRVLHNWIHKITEPPPIPNPEVMKYRIDAQRVVTSLFSTIRISNRIVSRQLSDAKIHHMLVQKFDEASQKIADAKRIPPEFQLVELPDTPISSIEDMSEIGSKLGKFVVARTIDDAMMYMHT
jgi:hypothetical protein